MAIVNALLDRGELAYFENVPVPLDEQRDGYDASLFLKSFDHQFLPRRG